MTYDHWKTTEPDDGYRREKCGWCRGTGVRNVTSHWHGYVQDGEAECEECGGSGEVEYGPDGYPCAPDTTTQRYFRRTEKHAAERDRVETIVDAVVRNAGIVSYPWATARVALTKILLDLEGRVGATDTVLEPLRAYIAQGDGRVK